MKRAALRVPWQLIVLVFLVALLIAVPLFRPKAHQATNSGGPIVPVYVARVNIHNGILGDTMLQRKMVGLVGVPSRQLKPQAVTSQTELLGYVAAITIPAGTQLTKSDLVLPSNSVPHRSQESDDRSSSPRR